RESEEDGDNVWLGDGSVRFGFIPTKNSAFFNDSPVVENLTDLPISSMTEGKKGMGDPHYRTVFVGGKKQLVPYTVTKAVTRNGRAATRFYKLEDMPLRLLDDSELDEAARVGFFPPAQSLVVKGTSRIHTGFPYPSDPNRRMRGLMSQSEDLAEIN